MITLASKRYTLLAYGTTLDSRYPDGGGSVAYGFESGLLSPMYSGAGAVSIISDASKITGNYSVLAHYVGGGIGVSSTPELKFRITDAPAFPSGLADIWVYWKIRIPENIYHLEDVENDGIAMNNKLLKLGTHYDGGSTQGINVILEFWPTNDATGDSQLAFHWTVIGVNTGAHSQHARVWGPAEAGTVREFICHVKTSSASGVSDGVIQTWHRPLDGSWTKIHDTAVAPLYPQESESTQTKFLGGYLMGWSNSGYTDATDYVLDDVTFSDGNIWGVS